MGYYTHFSGEITIDPPLRWSEIKRLPAIWVDDYHAFDRDVKLDIEETEVDVDEGSLITRTANSISPVTDDSYKGYEIANHIQEIVSTFPEHTYAGHIRGEGEETGDIRQYIVRNGKVLEQKATWTFPDNQ